MNGEVKRREFVALVAAGLPVAAGTGYGLALPPTGHGHEGSSDNGGGDPVFEHAVREIGAIYRRGQLRGVTGEDARATAAQLRTAAVRGTQTGIDVAAQKALRTLMRTNDRDTVLRFETDAAMVTALLKRYGIEVDRRRFALSPPDTDTRIKALDALTDAGVTGVLNEVAATLEHIGTTLDESHHRIGPVRRAQFGSIYLDIFCWQLLVQIQMISAQAAVVCQMGAVYPDLEVACASLHATLSVIYGMYYGNCA
jgi:hypothetical protein